MIEWVWLHFDDNIVNYPILPQCVVAVAASLFRWEGIKMEFFPRIAQATRLESTRTQHISEKNPLTFNCSHFRELNNTIEQPNVGKHQHHTHLHDGPAPSPDSPQPALFCAKNVLFGRTHGGAEEEIRVCRRQSHWRLAAIGADDFNQILTGCHNFCKFLM